MSQYWDAGIVKMVKVRLRNRRVVVGVCRDGSFRFFFTSLLNGRSVVSKFVLTEEATIAMIRCILDLKNKFKETL